MANSEITTATPYTRLEDLLARTDLVQGLRYALEDLKERSSSLPPAKLTEEIEAILKIHRKEMAKQQIPQPPMHNPIIVRK